MTKAYVVEQRSAEARALFLGRDHTVLVSQLVRTELASALARRIREGAMIQYDGARILRAYLAHLRRRYQAVPLTEDIQRTAEELLFRHTLRAADALQVASAIVVKRALAASNLDFRFVSADRQQATAATAEGIGVVFLRG